MNMLLQTSQKEMVAEFLKSPRLTSALGQHVFAAPEEALRSQIVELFKSVLDMS